jgi:alpha-ketoglutarate-dependent taurine dioxygenase
METKLSKLLRTKAENVANAPRVEYSSLAGEQPLPLVVRPRSSGLILTEWVREHKELLAQQLDAHGGILFRGFGINTVEKFRQFIGVFDAAPLAYKQRSSPRYEVAENIYHSTTYPADQSINMHSENSYSAGSPRRIVFCCVQPAAVQGETPIADNRLVARYLSPATREKFRQRGVKYVRNLSRGIGLSWQEVFQTDDRQTVEAECRNGRMQFAWEGDDRLVLSWTGGAFYDHPAAPEPVWFNHAFFFHKYALPDEVRATFDSDADLPFNTYFGDGSEISRAEIEEVRAAYEKATVRFPWEKGDVLLLDNMLTAHGRSPYQGDRQIIVSMF